MQDIILDGPVGAEVTVRGQRYLYFGGTDYLGMAGRPEVCAGGRRAIQGYGISSSASRTSSGTTKLHLELEAAISRFAGTEAAVLLSSGYLSMRALLSAVAARGDRLLLQREAHSSIREAAEATGLKRLEFSLDKLEELEKELGRLKNFNSRLLVVAEGVAPLYGTVFPLPEVLGLLEGCDYLVLLDDAHAFGVLGPHGRGVADHFGCAGDNVLACATLSKAFGSYGGCVPGSRERTANLRQKSLVYISSTPPPAPACGAALAALDYLLDNPALLEGLRANASRLKKGLASLGLPAKDPAVPIAPVCLGQKDVMQQLNERLFQAGIIAPYSQYPGSPEGGLIRLVVTVSHTEEQIDRLIECLRKFI